MEEKVEELVEKAKEGNNEAFTRIVFKYSKRLVLHS